MVELIESSVLKVPIILPIYLNLIHGAKAVGRKDAEKIGQSNAAVSQFFSFYVTMREVELQSTFISALQQLAMASCTILSVLI